MIDSSTLLTCRSTTTHWRSRGEWVPISAITDRHLVNVVKLLRAAAEEAISAGYLEDKDREDITLHVDAKNANDLIHQVHPGYGTMLLELVKRRINPKTLQSEGAPVTFAGRPLSAQVVNLTQRVFALERERKR